jgi:SAM-dependent methyltransferase
VTAVDLAERLLVLAREKAQRLGLANIEFLQADMAALGHPDGHFDAVVCVFGIFFVPNMESALAELWRMVRPGGKLAVTTWGPRFFAPAYDVWNTAVQQVHPDLHAAYHPWDRIKTPEALRALFRRAGIPVVDIQPEDGVQPLHTPEDFWTIVLGSGLRWTADRLGPEGAEQVKAAVLARLAEHRVDRIETNVIYAVAVRP